MKANSMKWVYITLAGFVLFLAAWLIMAVYSDRIEMSVTTYFFLLVIAALCATGFLSGALRSSANYSGNVYKGKLTLSGSVVIFVLILLIGYRFRPVPKDAPFDLTIYAYGPGGKSDPLQSGQIKVQDGNEIKTGTVDANGRTVIPNVNPTYLGKAITITSSMDGFHIPGGDTQIVVPKQALPVIYLQLARNNDSIMVKGNVTRGGKTIIKQATLNFPEFSRLATTDNQGNFQIYLPVKPGYRTALQITQNGRIVYNYNVLIADFLNIQVDE